MTSGIERWDAEYTNDPTWGAIEELVKTLREVEPASEDEAQKVDRLEMTLQVVLGRRSTPSLLVSPTMMSNLQTTVIQQLAPQIKAWAQNRNPAHLSNASSYLNNLLEIIRGWPVDKEQSLRSAAASLRESVKLSRDHLGELQSSVAAAKAELKGAVDSALQRLEEREVTSTYRSQQLEQGLRLAETKLNQIDSRIDSIITQQQERFDNSEKSRLDKHQENLEAQTAEFAEALDAAVQQSRQSLEAQERSGKDILARLGELKREVEGVVGAVGTASTANWYRDHANDQQRIGNLWRWIAVIGVGLAVAVSILWVILLEQQDDSWRSLLVRSAISFTLLAGASFAGVESRHHREQEVWARRTELKLRALHPFIATVDEVDRQDLKKETARSIFILDGQPRPQQALSSQDEEEPEEKRS